MRKTRILFTGLFFLFIAGCIPGKYLSFDTLEPAEITFPPDVKKVLVFNFAYLPSADTSAFNEVHRLKPKEQYFVDTIVIHSVFNGLFSVLDNSPASFLNDAPYYELRPEDTTAFLKPLSQAAIDHLCDTFNVDAVISFEYYALSLDVRAYNTVTYDEGFEYVGAADEALYRVMFWRIYDRQEGVINEKMMRDTLYWSAYGADEDEARRNLPEIGDILREAFWYGGYKYGTEISPSWDEVKRSYFEIQGVQGDSLSLDEDRLKRLSRRQKEDQGLQGSLQPRRVL